LLCLVKFLLFGIGSRSIRVLSRLATTVRIRIYRIRGW